MLITTTQKKYEKDLVVCIKRNYDIEKLKDIVYKLSNKIPLAPKHKNHKLQGDWIGFDECHIKNDWLLVYKKTNTHLILVRTGTHSDIFG